MAAAAVAVALLANGPAEAFAGKDVVERGSVRAVLSYERTERYFDFENVRLEISHSGQIVYRKHFEPLCKDCSMAPDGYGKGKPLRLRNLDSDSSPEVITTFYTGGAHCCTYSVVFDRRGSDYMSYRHNWLDAGFRLTDRDRDGAAEFSTADARFAYKYGCFACSRFPVQVFGFRDGFVNRGGDFPKLVRRDARRLHRDYRAQRGSGSVRPILAAFVADKCTLGECQKGFRVVRRALRRGYLDKQDRYDSGPYGKRYVRSLKRFLKKLGYR